MSSFDNAKAAGSSIASADWNLLNNLKGATKTVATVSGADYYVDGTADEVQINAAITAVNALGGGVVYLKQGTYSLAATVDMLSNVSLIGSGFGNTNLAVAADVNVIELLGTVGTDKTNMCVKDLKVTGYYDSVAGTTSNGIYVRYALDSTIQNCYVTKNNHGIYLFSDNERIGILYNRCTENDDDGIADTAGNIYSVIHGNWSYVNGDCGIHMTGGASYLGRATISANHLIKNGSGAGGGGTSNHGILLEEVRNVVCNSNFVYDNEGDGIKIYGDTLTGGYSSICGNVIRDNELHGINVHKSTRVSVIGNKIMNGGTAVTDHGIYVHTNSDRNTFIGNDVSGYAGYGIYIDGASEANNTVNLNSLAGNTTGTIYDAGTDTVHPRYHAVASLDLSGGATDLVVHHAITDGTLVGYTLLYTEASSADAGVTVEIGRYQDGVALDDDYFDQVTSEGSKALGYAKTYYSSDLTQVVVDDGDTITAGTAGGKVGTGEILVVLKIADTG
jgi:parallel beta-helix repeat protein